MKNIIAIFQSNKSRKAVDIFSNPLRTMARAILRALKAFFNFRDLRWLFLFLFALPVAAFLHFGIYNLGKFETADEYRWIYFQDSRIPQYWQALKDKNWAMTDINDKPGVTLALASWWPLASEDINYESRFVKQMQSSNIFDPVAVENLNFAFRLPVLIWSAVFAVLWFFLLRKIAEDSWLPLIAASLVLLSPLAVGISQVINPDALLWSTALTSLLFFWVFLRSSNLLYAIFSGVFLGLAYASKYTSIILVPFYALSTFTYLAANYEDLVLDCKIWRKKLFWLSLGFPLAFASAVGIFSLALPAVFVKKDLLINSNEAIIALLPILPMLFYPNAFLLLDSILLKGFLTKWILVPFKFKYFKRPLESVAFLIFAAVLIVVAYNWSKGNPLGVVDVPFDSGRGKDFAKAIFRDRFLLEFYALVFASAPVALLLAVLGWIKNAIFPGRFSHELLSGGIFIMAFAFAVAKQDVLATPRYSIMLYPVLALVAGISLYDLVDKFKYKKYVLPFLFLAVLGSGYQTLDRTKPFYYSYGNFLLPNDRMLSNTWGFGGYQAAQFLNEKNKNGDMIIWSDYEGVCPFFAGRCMKDSDIKWNKESTVRNTEYYVITRRGNLLLKDTSAKILSNAANEPIWELLVDGRADNYVRIYENVNNDLKY